MFDKVRNEYVPTIGGLGMHVEVRDPEIKVVMSRVRWKRTHPIYCMYYLLRVTIEIRTTPAVWCLLLPLHLNQCTVDWV